MLKCTLKLWNILPSDIGEIKNIAQIQRFIRSSDDMPQGRTNYIHIFLIRRPNRWKMNPKKCTVPSNLESSRALPVFSLVPNWIETEEKARTNNQFPQWRRAQRMQFYPESQRSGLSVIVGCFYQIAHGRWQTFQKFSSVYDLRHQTGWSSNNFSRCWEGKMPCITNSIFPYWISYFISRHAPFPTLSNCVVVDRFV